MVERVAAELVRVALPEVLLEERTALELLLEERVALPDVLLEERTALEEELLLERVALLDVLLEERVALLPEVLLEERVALVEEELLRVSCDEAEVLLVGAALELDLVEDDTELEDLVEEPEEEEREAVEPEEERVELLLLVAVPLLFLVCASISGAVSMENPTNTEAAIVINFLIAS